LRIFGPSEVATGPAAAHEQRLVHRDIKPDNLWLEAPAGRVKILDFGLARGGRADNRLTHEGIMLGAPSYMSPEQATGAVADHRADLFSLGCVLYLLSTGRQAFPGKDVAAVVNRLLIGTPAPPREANPDIPADLEILITQLIEKDPDRRPESALAVADRLRVIERNLSVVKRNNVPTIDAEDPGARTAAYVVPKPRPVRRRMVSVAIGLLLAVVVGTAMWQFVIRLTDKDGRVTVVPVAEGTKVEIEKAGPKFDGTPRAPGPADALRAADIPAARLALIGGKEQAPKQLVALLGDARMRHAGMVQTVVYSPDGKVLATASLDHTVSVWVVATGEQKLCLSDHETQVIALAFSPDGPTLVSACNSKDATGDIYLWDVATGKRTGVLHGHDQGVMEVAFAPDGRTLVSAAEGDMIIVWDVAARKQRLKIADASGSGLVRRVRLLPDGKTMIHDGGGRLVARAVATGEKRWDEECDYMAGLAVSPDGKTVAVASWKSGDVTLFNSEIGESQASWKVQDGNCNDVRFSPDGALLATTGSVSAPSPRWEAKAK
jgi:hypothetical protein